MKSLVIALTLAGLTLPLTVGCTSKTVVEERGGAEHHDVVRDETHIQRETPVAPSGTVYERETEHSNY